MKANKIVITYEGQKHTLDRKESKYYPLLFETDRWRVHISLLLDNTFRIMINKSVKKSENEYHTQFCYDCYCSLSYNVNKKSEYLFLNPATCKCIRNNTKWFTIEPMIKDIYNQLKEEIDALHPFDLIHDIRDLEQFIYRKMKSNEGTEYMINNSLRFGIGENSYTTSEEALQAKEKEPLVLLNLFNGFHVIAKDTIVFFLYCLIDRDGQLTVSEEGKTKTVFTTPNKKSDEWWNSATNEIKSLFSGYPTETEQASFWEQLQESDRNSIYQYYQYKTGKVELQGDDAHSLLMEIICELADLNLEKEYNISREEMCDGEGSFLEKYQDRFNDLYDDIEDSILSCDFIKQ